MYLVLTFDSELFIDLDLCLQIDQMRKNLAAAKVPA